MNSVVNQEAWFKSIQVVLVWLTTKQTKSIKQTPSWGPNSRLPSQESSKFLWTQIVRNCIHKILPLSPVMNLIYPVYILMYSFSKIDLNISSHIRADHPSGLFPSGLPTETLYPLLTFPNNPTCQTHQTTQSNIMLTRRFWSKISKNRNLSQPQESCNSVK
jgi:hypothetical protein